MRREALMSLVLLVWDNPSGCFRSPSDTFSSSSNTGSGTGADTHEWCRRHNSSRSLLGGYTSVETATCLDLDQWSQTFRVGTDEPSCVHRVRHDVLPSISNAGPERASMRAYSAATERGATRYRVPVTGGAAGGSMMSSGDSRAVSIHRCQPAIGGLRYRRQVEVERLPIGVEHHVQPERKRCAARAERCRQCYASCRPSPGNRAGHRASRSRRGAAAR